jgi:hypothetical protein
MMPMWWCEACEKWYIHGRGHDCQPSDSDGDAVTNDPQPGQAQVHKTNAEENKAEQKKTVEQSYPEMTNPHNTDTALPVGDKQNPGHTVNPLLAAPYAANVGATCPHCGDCPCRIRAARRARSITM